VQAAEARDALVVAQNAEWVAQARLNAVMGRNAALPVRVVEIRSEPPFSLSLAECLEAAEATRREVVVAREAIAAARSGRDAAAAEFLPSLSGRGSLGWVDGANVVRGVQEGAALHLNLPLYSGGRRRGELRSAAADIEAALADAQVILDAVSLQVSLAYRGVVASRERIDLARTAVVQAEENLRLVRARYRNGNATPTDIVDSEAALTRSQQRFYSATYTYLAALARLNYAVGRHQGAFTEKAAGPALP